MVNGIRREHDELEKGHKSSFVLVLFFDSTIPCNRYLTLCRLLRTRLRVVAVQVTNNIPAAKLYSCTCVYKMIYDRLSDKMEERRRLDNVTSNGYRRGESRSLPEKEEHEKWECKRSTIMQN